MLLNLFDGAEQAHVLGLCWIVKHISSVRKQGGRVDVKWNRRVRKPREPRIVVWFECTMAVDHDMNSYARRKRSDDPIRGVKQLNAPTAIPAREGHLTRRQLQGGKQARSAIAFGVGTATDKRATIGRLEMAMPAFESPAPRLLTAAYDARVFRWLYVEPNNIPRSGDEFRRGVFIPTQHCLGWRCRCQPRAYDPKGRSSVHQCRRHVRSPGLSRPSPQGVRGLSSIFSLQSRAVARRPASV